MAIGRKTGGRKPGTPNKRSQKLLYELENNNDFHVAKELIEIYQLNKKVYASLMAVMSVNIESGRTPEYGMNEDQLKLYTDSNKTLIEILVRLLSYLYPKLKAIETNTTTGDKVIFNITGMADVGYNASATEDIGEGDTPPPHVLN